MTLTKNDRQLRGESRLATVDLFAAGAVLHEMLDGRMFRYDAIDDARLLGMAIDGIVPPLGHRMVGALEELRVGLLEKGAYRVLRRQVPARGEGGWQVGRHPDTSERRIEEGLSWRILSGR